MLKTDNYGSLKYGRLQSVLTLVIEHWCAAEKYTKYTMLSKD